MGRRQGAALIAGMKKADRAWAKSMRPLAGWIRQSSALPAAIGPFLL
jgi:hypothetical protein